MEKANIILFGLLLLTIIFVRVIKSLSLPKAIYNTNETAEDLVDYAQTGNWNEINSKVEELNSLYKTYREDANGNKLSQQLLDFYSLYLEQLSKGIVSKNAYQIAFAANQITGIGVAFDEHFKHKTPSAVSRLDYLGRELMLETKATDSKAFNRRLEDIDYTWKLLKPEILNHHGIKQAENFENLVSNIKSLKDKMSSTEIVKAISKYSDQIDELEKLF